MGNGTSGVDAINLTELQVLINRVAVWQLARQDQLEVWLLVVVRSDFSLSVKAHSIDK